MTRSLVLAVTVAVASIAVAKPGAYKDLGGAWADVRGVAALDGKLYIISGAHLWETTTDGKYKDLGGGWDNVAGIAALDGKLYIISGGKLWATDKTGKYEDL